MTAGLSGVVVSVRLEKGALVDVRYRDGQELSALPAGNITPSMRDAEHSFWRNNGNKNDIISYRLHKPQEAEQAKADDEADLNECIGQDAAPVWNGEGLPPVGCECQYRKHKKSEQSEWFTGVVRYASEFTVVIQPVCYHGETVGHPVNFEFRPIRSEAERKRDGAIEEMIKIATMYTTKSLGLDLVFNSIYNSIAAGEIPGVKLED